MRNASTVGLKLLPRGGHLITKNDTFSGHLDTVFSLQNAVLILILLFSVTGNSYIITMTTWSRWKNKRKDRKSIDYLTTHLAVMDLLLVITSVPEMLSHNIYSTFMFGPIGCKIIYPLSTHAVIASVLTLLIIAYERYQASKTQTIIMRSKHTTIILSAISFVSIVLVCPYSWVLTYESKSTVDEALCFERWGVLYRRMYTLVLFIVQYSCPVLLMSYYYYHTWKNIKTSTNNLILRMSVDPTPLLKGGTPSELVTTLSTGANISDF
eukprot:TCONS_00010499-protein